MQTVIILSALVALAWGCCTPDQWEGGEGVVTGYSGPFKKQGLIREYIKVHYDYTNRQTAIKLYYSNGGIKAEYRVVAKFDKECEDGDCGYGKMYIVTEKGRCYKKHLRRPFRKACLPKEAKFMGDYFVGLEGGLKASAYEFDNRGFMASVSVSKVDEGVCVPIGENVAKHRGRFSTLSSVGFINLTPGIKNATVFDIPKECEETEEFNFLAPELLSREETHLFAL